MITPEHKHHILLADDDLDLCAVLKSYLEKKNLLVSLAYNGADAYDKIHDIKPALIILDIEMDGLDGFQLAMMLQKEKSTIPVIFMSGRKDTDSVTKGFQLGAEDYIRKPVDPEELFVRIQCRLKERKEAPVVSYSLGRYSFSPVTLEILDEKGNIVSTLPSIKGRILTCLCENTGKTLSRDDLSEAGWGQKTNNSRTVDMHVSGIRKCIQNSGAEIRKDYAHGYQLIVKCGQ